MHAAEIAIARARPRALRAACAPRSCSPARCSPARAGPVVPPPGGDVIGRRRLDPHIHAFAELGAEIEIGEPLRAAHRRPARQAHLPRRGERDGDRERGHGRRRSTPGETVIGNAACEPHVQDLCRFLVSLGAEIEGIESNVLRIQRRREPRAAASGAIGARAHRGRRASSASPRSPAATSRSRASSPKDLSRSCPPSSGSASDVEIEGTTRARPAGPGARDPRTTSAGTSRRSRTARGRRSRPT